LDGIRCLKIEGRALTRSYKPISNRFAREWIEANLPDGVDGELMLRGGTFNATTSAIGRESGEPDFVFHVFDYVSDGIDVPYACRMQELARLPEWDHVEKVLPVEIADAAQLAVYEEECLAAGYEGVMVRDPASPYKCGRSTEREGWLLKIKRFEDAEAVVLEPYEGMTNQNEAERDAFGRTKRSMAQAGMVGRGELGGFIVRTLDTGVEFRLGYNHVLGGIDRVSLWIKRESLIGKLVKFKHQPSGAKDAPRFPKFVGFREAWDM
jgi:DNA ligase-1